MTKQDDKTPSDTKQFEILANAISDVGYWSWWTEQLPDAFQIEFGGTQLYFPPISSTNPPQTQIAIQFRQPTSINFISKNSTNVFEWVELLHEDKIEPPTCSYGEFSFGDNELTKSLLQQVRHYRTDYGSQPTAEILKAPFSLVFWCGDIGLAIAAKELKLLNHLGDIALADIAGINKQWWDYWRNYWDKRESDEALPKDYACEVTIPLKS